MASEKKPGDTKKPTDRKKAVSKKAADEKKPFAELSEPKAMARVAPDKRDGQNQPAQQAPWQLLVAFVLVLAFLVGYGLLT